jgi:hypothetical protein
MAGKEIRSATKEPGKPPKVFSHLTVTPGAEGGVSVEHHFTSYEHKSEMHPFGASEGKQALQHIGAACNIGGGEEE